LSEVVLPDDRIMAVFFAQTKLPTIKVA